LLGKTNGPWRGRAVLGGGMNMKQVWRDVAATWEIPKSDKSRNINDLAVNFC
jgi:hypothetical protein